MGNYQLWEGRQVTSGGRGNLGDFIFHHHLSIFYFSGILDATLVDMKHDLCIVWCETLIKE